MKNEERFFYLLAYDMGDNKRRSKLAKLLESLGLRVQGSVFEGWLTKSELSEIRRRSEKLIHPEEDSLRIYPICGSCRERMILLGSGETCEKPGLLII